MVGSGDAEAWYDLVTLTNGPQWLRYLYLYLDEPGHSRPPAIREIMPEAPDGSE
jgi:hypothetical protein